MTPEPDLTVGTEVEYPATEAGIEHTTLERRARGSSHVYNDVRDDYGHTGWPGGRVDSDPTAGLELTSDTMSPDELAEWYRMSIAELSKYDAHEPTGVAQQNGASTIGLHIHISPLSEAEARCLYDISMETWFRIFACSSLTENDPDGRYRLFRDAYCSMNFAPEPRSTNDCVTRVNGNHWEWRLVEPVTPDHFELIMEFLKRLKDGAPGEAREFARGLVDSADHRLTAIKRAKKIGITEKLLDEPDEEIDPGSVSVMRDAFETSEEFFNEVRSHSERPYIYSVRTDDNQLYYVMYTQNYADDRTFENMGVTYTPTSVLDAETLSEVTGSRASELRERVREERGGMAHPDSPSKSEAVDELVDRLAAVEGITASTGGDQ